MFDESLGREIKIPYQVKGNKLIFSINRKDIIQTGNLSFDFHWADKIEKIGDIKHFFYVETMLRSGELIIDFKQKNTKMKIHNHIERFKPIILYLECLFLRKFIRKTY